MAYITIPVKTWYLSKKKDNLTHLEYSLKGSIVNWQSDNIEEYLEIYNTIGKDWGWTGRVLMDKNKLSEWLSSKNCQLYILEVDGEKAGFIEFDCTKKDSPEIVYFGLLPNYIGKKLGLPFLTHSINLLETKLGSEYIWLHTCEYDHPSAKKIYEKAGFSIYKEEIDEEPYDEDFLKEFKEKYRS